MEPGKGVCHTDTRMGNFFFCLRNKVRVETHHMANHVHKGVEYDKHPHHAEHVEEHVRQCRTTRLRTRRERGQIRRDRSTDVFAHHKRDTLINREYAARAENQGNRHDGRRRLHAHRKYSSQQEEQERTEDTPATRR